MGLRSFFGRGEKESSGEESTETSTDYQELLDAAQSEAPPKVERVSTGKLESQRESAGAEHVESAVAIVGFHTETAQRLAELAKGESPAEAKAVAERANRFIQAEADVALVDRVRNAGKDPEVAGASLEVSQRGAEQAKALVVALERAKQHGTTEVKTDGTANAGEFWTVTHDSQKSLEQEREDKMFELAEAITYIRTLTGETVDLGVAGSIQAESAELMRHKLVAELNRVKDGGTVQIELGLGATVVVRAKEQLKEGHGGTETNYGASIIIDKESEYRGQPAEKPVTDEYY